MEKTKIDVQYVAKLARIKLTEKELSQFSVQLSGILSYIEQLNTLDTKDVEPTSHVLPLKNVYREDVVKPSLPVDKVLRNAPDAADGFFRVPKIIEEA